MDKVVIDTNVILDYLSAKRPRHLEAVMLLETLLSSDDLEPVVLAGSIKDVYYIMCRHYGKEAPVRSRLNAFRSIVSVYDLSNAVLDDAFALSEPDLEDAIVCASAEALDARAIVTRDAAAFKTSRVPSMDAREFCFSLDE